MSPGSLLELLFARLQEEERHALAAIVRQAEEGKQPLYLVGGSVRDLLLGRPQLDLDLALEGDALEMATRVAPALGARATLHRRFGTASLRGPGFRLDIARTRAETYARPGVLPAVRPAGIAEDLGRRDYSVNAMALCLSGRGAGRLLDPRDGRRDLDRRRLRVLHDGSFRDDATRIMRGLRYEARLGFRLDRHTLGLLRRDLPYLGTISGSRLRRELLAACQLDEAPRALARAQTLGVLAAVHRALSWDGARSRALRHLRKWRLASDEACLCLLAAAHAADVDQVVARLSLRGTAARALHDFGRLAKDRPLAAGSLTPSRAAAALAPYSVPALAAAGALASRPERHRILWYLRRGRFSKPALDGRDLMALGVPEGPGLGALLARLREARLDGLVKSRGDEVALVRAALAAGAPGDVGPAGRTPSAVGA